MGYRAYDEKEKEYKAEDIRLITIAQHVSNGDYGYFHQAMAKAFLLANPPDRRILKEAWKAIVTKYNLVAEDE